jgi:hypothetical protein
MLIVSFSYVLVLLCDLVKCTYIKSASAYVALPTLSGPSNQLFSLVNSLAISLELPNVKSIYFPIEPHFIWRNRCFARYNTSFCVAPSHMLLPNLYLDMHNKLVNQNIRLLDERTRASVPADKLIICSALGGNYSEIDYGGAENKEIALKMLRVVSHLASKRGVSYETYEAAVTSGVTIVDAAFRELTCVRDYLAKRYSVVVLSYEHDVCGSRNYYSISSSGSRKSACPELGRVFSLGDKIFSTRSDFLRKINERRLLSSKVLRELRKTVFVHFRVSDNSVINNTMAFLTGNESIRDIFDGSEWAWRLDTSYRIRSLNDFLSALVTKLKDIGPSISILSNSLELKMYAHRYFISRLA